jgi:hypothetical protein
MTSYNQNCNITRNWLVITSNLLFVQQQVLVPVGNAVFPPRVSRVSESFFFKCFCMGKVVIKYSLWRITVMKIQIQSSNG